MLLLTYPTIDPIAIEIGPLAIRWYALAYIAGILGGWYYIRSLNQKTTPPVFTAAAIEDSITFAILGIIVGGRLGYALFYNFSYYFSHPLEILQVWQGGMSFHGGFLGFLAGIALLCRKHHIRFLAAMDLFACAAPLGILLGRLANFINGELYGRVTDAAVGMVFPGGGPLPRHPSQLYEATLEGAGLFLLLSLLVLFTPARKRTGLLSGVFLLGYASARTLVEQFREPDAQLGFLFGHLTMGQLLSFPMIGFGMWLIVRALFFTSSKHAPS